MNTEIDVLATNESLDALDKLLKQVIQPIVGREFSEKINENNGFQDGKDALKKIQMIKSTLEEIKNKINDLPDEDVIENKFCKYSVPNGLEECADDIYWSPEQDKENNNAFSAPIMKIRDNLLHQMCKEIVESIQKDSGEIQRLIMERQEELKEKLDNQNNSLETMKKKLIEDLSDRINELFQTASANIKHQLFLLWCIICLSCISLFGTLALVILYLLK